MAECALDAEGRLSLHQILVAFNSNVSEEHAWALFHQAARCFERLLRAGAACYLPTHPRHLLLHRDGSVHPDSLLQPGDDSSRPLVHCESEVVVRLALLVYAALDYAQPDDEERLVSPDLERLISDMSLPADDEDEYGLSQSLEGEEGEAARGDTDDEGIERDAERPARLPLRAVAERCVRHCAAPRDAAAAHYRAVCRALVAEALELSSFLARVRTTAARDLGAADDSADHLDTLHFADWSNRRIWRALQARFWMQVIGELRMGVQLKKVRCSRTPIEYELTPYEILMDDIRSRRYTLRKVDTSIPHNVKKDAHAMILEFIRSRPPLKKASERQLAAARREHTPREQLLRAIQRGRKLRPTPPRRAHPAPHHPAQHHTAHQPAAAGDAACASGAEAGAGVEARAAGGAGLSTPRAPPQRRLIKVDFDNLEDDEDEDEPCGTSPGAGAPRPAPRRLQPAPAPWARTAAAPRAPPRAHITHDEYHQFCDQTLESYDLATQCPSRRASVRRHTAAAGAGAAAGEGAGAQSEPQSRAESRASAAASLGSEELSWSRSSLQDELAQSQWQEALLSEERLSLTLDEIVHIRSVLTKAELEVLPVEGRVKEDVEKRRVCFLCLKTRFGIFGPWGQKCKLCKRTVCQKCCSKMRIPTEHFAHVPVVLLSPSLLPSPDEEAAAAFPRSLVARLGGEAAGSVGSAPGSPVAARRPEPASAPASRGGSALGQRAGPSSLPAAALERLRGVQMAVCLDCKALVLQIIRSSRASRSASRDRALRHLTLDLTPLYTPDC